MRLGLFDISGNIDENVAIDFQLQCRALPGGRKRLGAIILRINSQGGSLGPAQAMAEAIDTVRREAGIPWICVITDVALSAGFYLSQATDHAVATPASMLGGVGSLYRKFNLSELTGRLGIASEHISPNPLKDFSDSTREISAEKRKMVQEFCNQQSAQFTDYIRSRRKVKTEDIDYISQGGLITGETALNMGLVESSGSLLSAIAIACENVGVTTCRIEQIGAPRRAPGMPGLALRAMRSIAAQF